MAAAKTSRPLCVDLDGTLIKTDLLVETTIALCRERPWEIFKLPFWLSSGRARLKQEIANRVEIDVESLPYNQEVLTFLEGERAAGREIYLVTASDENLANAIAHHLDIFTGVIGSNGEVNLKGETKAKLLNERFGEFDYLGDHVADIAVWEKAQSALIVSSNAALIRKVEAQGKVERIFSRDGQGLKTLLRAIRVHQWVKNLLLFVPLMMAHRALELSYLIPTILAFFAFSFAASAVYLLNDLFDLTADRAHPTKRLRPFASGALAPQRGVIAAGALILLSIALSVILPSAFQLTLLIYFILTTAYSLRLKEVALLDIMVLASLYALRVLAGGYGATIPVSEWLIAFSMFLFLSLACVKRFSELYSLRERGGGVVKGRGYTSDDLELIAQLGTASGYISVLVLALYINSSAVVKLYGAPGILWLICPVLLFWVSRIWLLAHRGEIHEDPILFALRDKVSYVSGAICLAILVLSI